MNAIVGVATYAALLAGGLGVLFVLARRRALLAPVLVGAVAHLAIIVGLHWVSVARGDHGFLYRDDRGYAIVGERLSDAWSTIGWVDPTMAGFAGSHTVGYPMVVGFVFLLVGPSVLAAKVLNIVFGACAVLLAARIAEEVGLAHRARLVAWVVALWPTLLWWSGTMMKEQLAVALLLGAVLAALRLPRRGPAVGLSFCLTALALVRMPGFVAGSLVAVGIAVLLVIQRDRVAWKVGVRASGAIAVAVAVFLFGFSVGSPGAGITAYQAIVTTSDKPSSDIGDADSEELPIPLRVAKDVVTTYVAPYPWVFDEATNNWDRGLYPGMWLWYALLPTVIVGFIALRRNSKALVALLLPVAAFAAMGPLLSGIQFRQRSSIEVFMLIAAVAGAARWDSVAFRAAGALFVAAIVAGVHARSPMPAVLILCGVGVVAVVGILARRRQSRNGAAVGPTSPNSSLAQEP